MLRALLLAALLALGASVPAAAAVPAPAPVPCTDAVTCALAELAETLGGVLCPLLPCPV